MNLRTLLTFIVSSFVFYLSLQGLSLYIRHQQEIEIAKQNFVLLENVKHRFKLFLDVPITVGTVGKDYLAGTNLKTKDYGPLSHDLMKTRKELLGLNILDEKGKIFRVFPEGANTKALGKVSQNVESLKRSFERKEPFWFSPPFELYQGQKGFAFYFPLVQNSHLKGWLATVITSQSFEHDFNLTQFLHSFGLQILDEETNSSYYQTGFVPEGKEVVTSKAVLAGRPIIFSSWPIHSQIQIFLPWQWKLLISFLAGLFFVLLFRFYQQKKRARNQLEDISILLKLTSKEALSKLIDLQGEIFKIGSLENARYITNLIEQIDLLQTTAYFKRGIDFEDIDFLSCLASELDELKDLIDKKSLKLNFIQEKFVNITLSVNKWLFKSSVLSNILTYSILQAEAGTELDIEYRMSNSHHNIIFHTQRVQKFDMEGKEINLDRRMRVSKKVLTLYGGELFINEDLAGGLTIQIVLPSR